jgi:methyl-accepting chemotaxis protein
MNGKYSTTVKLFACFGAIVATAISGATYSVLMARHVRNTIIQEMVGGAKRLDETRQITISVANMRSAMRGVSMFSMMKVLPQVQKARTAFETSTADMRSVLQEVERTELNAEERAAVAEIRSGTEQWLASFGRFADLSASGHGEAASEIALKTMTPVIDVIQKRTAELGGASAARQNKATEAALSAMRHSETLNWAILLVLLLASVGAFVAVVRMVKTLRSIAEAVSVGAQEVANAATQVSAASQSLAQGSSEQAASLEETSAATEEINSMAQRNTENSEATAKIVIQSAGKFEQANQALDQMVVAAGEIDASSQKISKIIKVIDEIAFQTNILALNAAVEAARAGEAGMGFAVVADEVRNLAQRSSQAAKDTALLIEESIEKSRSGNGKVGQVAGALRAVTEDSARVKTLVEEMNLGSKEQARGLQQIAKSISEMEQVTQKTASEAEESAAAAEQLRAQSDSMNQIATKLTALVDGSAMGAA